MKLCLLSQTSLFVLRLGLSTATWGQANKSQLTMQSGFIVDGGLFTLSCELPSKYCVMFMLHRRAADTNAVTCRWLIKGSGLSVTRRHKSMHTPDMAGYLSRHDED